MTGFGKAEVNFDKMNFTIEVKSLNSKNIDIKIKTPSSYRNREISIRNLIVEKLKRGKIELSIFRDNTKSTPSVFLNHELINNFIAQAQTISKEININTIFANALHIPNVIQKDDEELSDGEWNQVFNGIENAIDDLSKFRLDEGEKLQEDLKIRIFKITESLQKISPFAASRIEKVKTSLSLKLDAMKIENIDNNRFEQELIYYLEKQDISEEQVRLAAHLDYFNEVMNAASPNGKKLGFIAQEIGREINTLGSKSSNFNMQKIVVRMKDELEKMKEQILNVL